MGWTDRVPPSSNLGLPSRAAMMLVVSSMEKQDGSNSLQNLVPMWRLHDYSCYSYTIAPSTSTFYAMHAASVKMILGAVIPTSEEVGLG